MNFKIIQIELKRPFDFNSLRSSKLEALKGRTILARGKRDSVSAPPRVTTRQNKPLTANPRDSANLICGVPWFRLIAIIAICTATFVASGNPSAPVGLLVNGVSNPLAIDRDAIRFTWMSKDAERGERQTAYEILVLSSPTTALAASKQSEDGSTSPLWDSGRMNSGQSASVEYTGRALPAVTRFWWQVRIWDQTGKSSPYSAPACFDTGLNQDEWTAHYIWDGTSNLNNFAYFRKTFVVASKPALARVYVSAHNDYLLYFNGQMLGRGPARCDPYHYGQYNAYDVTKLVNAGTNVFAALGHWQGTWHDSGVNARPAFLLEAHLDFRDGSSSTIATDDSWKVLARTAFTETNATYFVGWFSNRAAIQFDSRLEPVGWKSIDFNDSSWAPATVVDRSNYHLFAQMAPLEREQSELKPVSITFTNGAWLVDFGRCIDGWPKLTMRANRAGDIVRVEYYELTGERRPAGWDQYTCRGGTEAWDADFGRHTSFQVLKISGYAGRLSSSDVCGMWAYCDADVEGRFHCSSKLLNDIYTMCERSARQNIQQGIISVDANREQSPWLADSWNIGNVLLYNDRNTMMIDKVVRDYAAEQMANGSFHDCSPAGIFQCVEWSMYWPGLLWQQYLFSGDETLLREMSPHLTRLLGWLKKWQSPKTMLLNPRTARITDYAGGNTPAGGYNIATACEYYEDLRIASRIFSLLGQPGPSDRYAREANEVRAGINSNLFNGKYYLARTDTNGIYPLASAWALRFDIERVADRPKIVDAIEQAGRPDIGGYGGDAFYSGLLNAGCGAYVVRDLDRYRPMLDGNKANWEEFSLGGEVNHAWTAYPAYIFLKYICGIQPTSGGFATFDVRPSTGGLTFAEGTVPTVKGLITTRWEKGNNGNFSLAIKVPANTRASIYIPESSNGNFTVTESGRQIWPATAINDPGVLAISQEDSSIKCVVGSGEYHFRETP